MMSSLSPTEIGAELPVLAPTVSDVAPAATDAEVPGKYEFTIPPSVGCGPSRSGRAARARSGGRIRHGTGQGQDSKAAQAGDEQAPKDSSVGDARYGEHAAAGLIRRDNEHVSRLAEQADG